MSKNENIIQIWKSKGFIGAAKLSKILKDMNIKIKFRELQDLLKEQKTNQIHKQFRKTQKTLSKIVTYAKDNNWQIDLSDMSMYSKYNQGYKYILLAIDVFSRKAHAQPVKNKTESSITDAFNLMIEKEKPLRVTSDKGSEFTNNSFKENADNKDISTVAIIPGDHNSLGLIDRFTRTLKNMISKNFTDTNSVKWYDYLQHYIDVYNSNPHGGLDDIPPDKVQEPENTEKILHKNIEKALESNKIRNDINVGDIVRIRIKGVFKKGYEPSYSSETYTVTKVLNMSAYVDDGSRHKISDLLKVNDNSTFTNIIYDLKKENKAKREFNREGLDKKDILETKRTRRKVEKFSA